MVGLTSLFRRREVGVDIKDDAILVAVGSWRGLRKSYRLLTVDDLFELPVPDAGEESWFETMGSEMREALEVRGIKSGKLNVVLSGRNMSVKYMEIPIEDKKQLRKAVGFELGKHYEVDRYEVQFNVVNRSSAGSTVMNIGVEKSHIGECKAIAENLGSKSKSMSPSFEKLGELIRRNAILEGKKDMRERTAAFVYLDAKHSDIAIFEKGICKFFKTMHGKEMEDKLDEISRVFHHFNVKYTSDIDSAYVYGGKDKELVIESLGKIHRDIEVEAFEDLGFFDAKEEVDLDRYLNVILSLV